MLVLSEHYLLCSHNFCPSVLGIADQGLAIPIIWEILPKKGNSQTTERIDVMDKFAALLGKERVVYLTGDREFIGKQWFKYLSFNWGFRIRIHHTDLIGDGRRYLTGNVIFSSLVNW